MNQLSQLQEGFFSVSAGKACMASQVEYQNGLKGLWFRVRGLQFRKELPPSQGILIMPCNSIHMFCMNFPIDAVFLDRRGEILHICHSIKPWRVSPMIAKAKAVLEINAGICKELGVTVGDSLNFERLES